MNVDNSILDYSETMELELRSLYGKYGYTQYKMSKFEEYDLYARNKDFLVSDSVLTFMDHSGKLMALKPDVTLSIVRSSRDTAAGVQKLYYAENVYRISKGSQSFQEIMQAGLECIGDVDNYCISEVLTLAAESLRCISDRYVLNISHLGIISAALDALGVDEGCRQKLLKCIGDKNLHELSALCAQSGADPAAAEVLRSLLLTRGAPEDVLPKLEALHCPSDALSLLRTVSENLNALALAGAVCIDFSVINDMAYYNGVVFKGYVDAVPVSVISGGQYDRLMEKMGRRSRAIGFAVYLDALERLNDATPGFDLDLVLLYDDNSDSASLCRAVKELSDRGVRVSAQKCVPDKLKYRQLAKLCGSEVKIIETNA